MVRLLIIAMFIVLIALVAAAGDPGYPIVRSGNVPYVASCLVQDELTIEDDGPDRAIVTFFNGGEKCSSTFNITLTSPNGIEVDIEVEIGSQEHLYREVIRLFPVDPQVMAFPPEGLLYDGTTEKFVLMKGMS